MTEQVIGKEPAWRTWMTIGTSVICTLILSSVWDMVQRDRLAGSAPFEACEELGGTIMQSSNGKFWCVSRKVMISPPEGWE